MAREMSFAGASADRGVRETNHFPLTSAVPQQMNGSRIARFPNFPQTGKVGPGIAPSRLPLSRSLLRCKWKTLLQCFLRHFVSEIEFIKINFEFGVVAMAQVVATDFCHGDRGNEPDLVSEKAETELTLLLYFTIFSN